MSDLRTVFVNLEDASTQAGLPLHKALEGDAILNKNAHGALVAKDSAENFKYLEVDDAGALKVSLGSAYACLSDSGTHAGDTSYQTLATIALTTDKVYKDVEALVSCFRDTVFQIIHNDNGVPTILADGIRAGAGAYNQMARFECMEFTAGATGTQELLIKGKNTVVASTMDATVSVKEMAY